MIEGFSMFFGMLLATPAGELSDRTGRKRLYALGHIIMGVTRFSHGLVNSLWMLLPLRWFYRVGMAFRYAARDPLLAESSAPEKLGLTFAAYELSDCIGSFLGPLIPIIVVGVIGESLKIIQTLFMFSIIPNLLSVVLIVTYVYETVQLRKHEENKVSFTSKFRLLFSNRNLLNFTMITSFSSVFAMTVDVGLLYLTYGDLKANIIFSSVMFTFWTATTALAALPAGRVSDRMGRRFALVLALIFQIFSISVILVYHFMLRNILLLPFAFISLGLYDTFLNVSSKTFVADNTSTNNRGMIMGVYTTVDGVSRRSLSPIIAGFMFSSFSYATPFMVGLAVSVVAVLLIYFIIEESSGLSV
jgi:MFS family permease